MRRRKKQKGLSSPYRMLLWTGLITLVLGLIAFGRPLEDLMRMTRNNFHPRQASGDIVLVTIDDKALREIGRWPWPRRHHAVLTEKLTAAGARRIFFDIVFETRSNPVDDKLLAQAIDRSRRVTLPVRGMSGPEGMAQISSTPLPMLGHHARLASIAVQYNYQNAVWQLPYAVVANGRHIPSFAASLAKRNGTGVFKIDYSVDPTTVPTVGADAVLQGRFDRRMFAGKDVIIGTNSEVIGDQYFIPGVGKMGGVYVQIAGAETLKLGQPVDLGWFPVWLLGIVIVLGGLRGRRWIHQQLVFAGGTALLLIAPIFLDANLIFVETTPALFVILSAWSALSWRALRNRGLVNPTSGLPNLNALRSNPVGRAKALIVAKILNYAEIAAALPPEQERQLVDQIVSRLRVGAPDRELYQGDGGIFAWFEEPRVPFGNHIDALYALFRNPARVDGLAIDLTISFGVEIGSSRSLANRLASALVAADEAAHDGLRWKYHDPETLENASWKLSMLGQLDSAVEKGEVWVAYQPKLDLKTHRIVGAEALARWTHPEKGPIAASEFIAAAEQHDRIGKLTDFVLEQAIGAAVAVNRTQSDFSIAVNLSAKLLTDKGLVLRLRAMLARHGLPARLLTLELTETAELGASGPAFEMLAALRELGVTIAIDDYGTGLSTLDYLKKIPASEIKIDQSFVKGIVENRSDRVMVQSTIALAHSLGRKVVAEGVEGRDVLDSLIDMNCDVAQGFVIGRPMSLESLAKRLAPVRSTHVA